MMFLLHLKSVARDLLLPPAGPLLLGLAGLWLWSRRPRLARALIALCVASLWLLSTPLIADAITRRAEAYAPFDWTRPSLAQAIVIISGGGYREWAPEYGSAAADPVLLERLAYGAFIARRTRLPILVSGFQAEAEAMRETLRHNFDIEPRWVDDQAYDTFQNARNSVRILRAQGVERVLLVTRGTHMLRSVREFTAAGVQVIPAPIGLTGKLRLNFITLLPHPDALLQSYAALYELLGEPMRAFLAATHLRQH
jgi:uncharacterized SAM-binding protein YcdF (DUF218 family)